MSSMADHGGLKNAMRGSYAVAFAICRNGGHSGEHVSTLSKEWNEMTEVERDEHVTSCAFCYRYCYELATAPLINDYCRCCGRRHDS